MVWFHCASAPYSYLSHSLGRQPSAVPLRKFEYILARRREVNPPTETAQHEADARLVHRVEERDKRLEELEAKRSIGQNALAGLTQPSNSVVAAVVNVMVR